MNYKLKYLCLFLFLFFTGKTLIAQEMNFTLDEAIHFALKNNRDLKVAMLNVEKSEAAVDEAFGYALPSIDVSANFSHFLKKPKMSFPDFEALLTNATYSILFDENVIPFDANKFVPIENTLQAFVLKNNYESSIQLTQTLFNSAVFRGIGASQIYLDLARENLKSQVSQTVLDVQKAFYGVLLTKQLLEITEASFQNARDNLRNANAMYEQGLVSEFDYLRAEVQVENIRPALLQIENALVNAKEGFKIVLGLDQQAIIDVVGEFDYEAIDVPDISDLIDKALQSNFSLKTMDYKLKVDEAFIDLDRAEYWPNLAAFGNYTYAGSADDFNFQNYSSATVGVSFSINLWKGNRTKNKVEQSTITLKQSREQFDQLKDFIESQIKAKVLELERAKELVNAQTRNVDVAERAYKIATVRYKEGTGSQLEIQNAEMDLRKARTNKIQSIYDYKIAKLELDQLLGSINPDYFDPFFYSD